MSQREAKKLKKAVVWLQVNGKIVDRLRGQTIRVFSDTEAEMMDGRQLTKTENGWTYIPPTGKGVESCL